MSYLPLLIVGVVATGIFLIGTCFWSEIEDYSAAWLGLAALGSVAITSFTAFGALNYEKHACEEYGNQIRVAHSYDGNTGCWLKIDNRWVNEDNYRETTQHPAILG